MDKATIRAMMKARLHDLGQAEISRLSEATAFNLAAHPLFMDAGVIFCYAAMGEEADPAFLVNTARALGKRVAFPFCNKDRRMTALIPMDDEAMEVGRFGIITPNPARSIIAEPEQIDLVVVPGLAFDRDFGRLGRGAGFYDRYLAKCPGRRVGFTLEAQLVSAIPMEAYDIRMDAIVTECGIQINNAVKI